MVCGYFYLSVGFLIVDTYFDFANIFWPAKFELVKEWVFNIMHCHFDGRFVGLTVPPLCIIAPKVYCSKIWKKVQIRKCVHFKNKINFFENKTALISKNFNCTYFYSISGALFSPQFFCAIFRSTTPPFSIILGFITLSL